MQPRLIGLEIADPAGAWEHAGFAVTADRSRVGEVTLAFRGRGEEGAARGIVGWALTPAGEGEVPGLPQVGIEPLTTEVEHPNGAVGVDHVVVGTSDLEATTAELASLGIEPRRTVADIPGRGEATFRFFLLGTCVLELVDPGDRDPGKPPRFWGLALVSRDLNATADNLGGACSPPRDAIQPGRRIVTVDRHRLGLSTRLAFMSPRESTTG